MTFDTVASYTLSGFGPISGGDPGLGFSFRKMFTPPRKLRRALKKISLKGAMKTLQKLGPIASLIPGGGRGHPGGEPVLRAGPAHPQAAKAGAAAGEGRDSGGPRGPAAGPAPGSAPGPAPGVSAVASAVAVPGPTTVPRVPVTAPATAIPRPASVSGISAAPGPAGPARSVSGVPTAAPAPAPATAVVGASASSSLAAPA